MFYLTTKSGRMMAVAKIESNTNKGRKTTSYQASEIYNDRIKEYVIEELREQFSENTVKELPIVSSVNICKRIVNELSCIYSDAPTREFTELTDDQVKTMELVYDDMNANTKLNLANRLYKNHDQCLIQIMPKHGALSMRVLKPHQWDSVPMDNDPETAKAIIISTYDNHDELQESADNPGSATGVETTYKQASENYKEELAFKKQGQHKVYAVYTMQEQFRMDSRGNILGEPVPNPLASANMLPFIDVSKDKEFEYWVRTENPYAQFTRSFNAAMSTVQQVVKMQGFAVGVLKGPQDLLMESITIGPNVILKLPNDEAAGITTDFQYVNPGSDIAGSIAYLEVLLTTFLSSNGIDPKTVTMSGEGQTYNSGIERLLSMIEKVSASRSDYDMFAKVEQEVYRLIKEWLSVLDSATNIEDKYRVGNIPDDSKVIPTFSRPELIKSEADELDIVEREIAIGISSPIKAIMDKEGLTRDLAKEKFDQYEEDTMGAMPVVAPIVEEEDEPRDIIEPNLADD